MTDIQLQGKQILSLIDLTSLNADDDDGRIEQLCRQAQTPAGPVAAVCVYPRFVSRARRTLDELGAAGIRVATVCNFPGGGDNHAGVTAEVIQCLRDGANEIDLVYPYRALLAGDAERGRELISAVKALCAGRALLKVILETGELKDPALIRRASEDAIAAGADFIKTSTGKVAVNATPEAAEIMLDVIAGHGGKVGFKPAGGMRSFAQARVYVELAEKMLGPGWVGPEHLRFGASSLLGAVLREMGLEATTNSGAGY